MNPKEAKLLHLWCAGKSMDVREYYSFRLQQSQQNLYDTEPCAFVFGNCIHTLNSAKAIIVRLSIHGILGFQSGTLL